jgi:hypothetical protein
LGFAFYLDGEIFLPFFGLGCMYRGEEDDRWFVLKLPERKKKKRPNRVDGPGTGLQ